MRSEQIKNFLAEGEFAVLPRFIDGVVSIVNSGEIAKKETNDSVEPSHSLEVVGDVAVITVDGATTKKHTWINAMCGGYVGYEIIESYVKKALIDESVKTILFNIDTPGGDVSGCDELGELIYAIEDKKTVTFYNNLGCSAGIWWGTASDEIYANKTAIVGSIGVMAGYYEPREDDRKVVVVSHNAKNKNCTLNGDCKERIQHRIDTLESVFFDRVTRNTAFTKDEIVENFDHGEVISADKALEIGFLDGIVTLDSLVKTLATMPSTEKIDKNSTGETVKKTLEELQAELDTANSTIESMQKEVDGISAKDDEIASLKAELTALKAEPKGVSKAFAKEAFAIASNNKLNMENTLALFDEESVAAMMVKAQSFKPSAGGAFGRGADTTPYDESEEKEEKLTAEQEQAVLDAVAGGA